MNKFNENNITKNCEKCEGKLIPVGIQYYSPQDKEAYASVFMQCTTSNCENYYSTQELIIH